MAGKQQAEDLQDFISCPVCLEPFRDAKQLPCLHIYCGKCLRQMTSGSHEKFPCPLCQKDILTDQDFPSCFYMNNLSEILSQKATHERCCNFCFCEDWKEMFLCRECFRKICPNCKVKHESSSGHTFQSLVYDEKDLHKSVGEDMLQKSSEPCPSHLQENLEFYCDSCDSPFCIRCAVTKHTDKPCRKRELSKVGREHRTRMYGILADFTRRSNEYASVMETLDQGQQLFENNVAMTVGEVEDQAEAMHAIIDKYKESVLKSVADSRATVVEDMGAMRKKLKDNQAIVKENGKGVESLLQFGKTTNVIKSSLKDFARFQDVLNALVPKIEIPATTFTVNRPRIPSMKDLQWHLEMSVAPMEETVRKETTEASICKQFNTQISANKVLEFQTSFYPGGIAVFRDGRIVVSENWGAKVILFKNNGKQQRVLNAPKGVGVTDLAVYREELVLAMTRSSTLLILDPSNGKLVKSLGLDIPEPSGIFACDDDIYVTASSEGSVFHLKLDGEHCLTYKAKVIGSDHQPVKLENPLYVVAGSSRLVVANTGNHSVEVFNRKGDHMLSFGMSKRGNGYNQLDRPRGVAVDEDENIIIADSNNNRLVALSLHGDLLGFVDIGSHTTKPACIAATGKTVYMTHGTWPDGPFRVCSYKYDTSHQK